MNNPATFTPGNYFANEFYSYMYNQTQSSAASFLGENQQNVSNFMKSEPDSVLQNQRFDHDEEDSNTSMNNSSGSGVLSSKSNFKRTSSILVDYYNCKSEFIILVI